MDICNIVRTVGELREALKGLPAGMKLNFSASCYEDADHYCSKTIRHWPPYNVGKGVKLIVETETLSRTEFFDDKKREVSEDVLRIRNSEWEKFELD